MTDADIPISIDTAFLQPLMPPAVSIEMSHEQHNKPQHQQQQQQSQYFNMSPSAPLPDNEINNEQHNQQQYLLIDQSNERVGLNKAASISEINSSTIDSLLAQGYPRGLAESLALVKRSFPLRIWIIDNSGSMRAADGNRIIRNEKTNEVRLISGCSRWSELQQTIEYHIKLAAAINAPTIFRLLNDPGVVVGPQQFSVAEEGQAYINRDVEAAVQTIMNSSPGGVTPLVDHMKLIREYVCEFLPELRNDGTKVAIIIATDGLPSDQQGYTTEAVKIEFEQCLRNMEGLPVWIVIRLCTQEEEIVEYYNSIDSKLELSIEVLDDFESEANEIQRVNPWLNYGLPLHRIREMGYYNYVMDLLDETLLSKVELSQFCKLLFGRKVFEHAPDPEIDWRGFVSVLDKALRQEKKQWNPITKRMEPWIDINELQKVYNPNGSSGGGFFSNFW